MNDFDGFSDLPLPFSSAMRIKMLASAIVSTIYVIRTGVRSQLVVCLTNDGATVAKIQMIKKIRYDYNGTNIL